MKEKAILLPVVFEDGVSREVALTLDAKNILHYKISVEEEPAGTFSFTTDMHSWQFTGKLSQSEQAQIAAFIQNYTDQDWNN